MLIKLKVCLTTTDMRFSFHESEKRGMLLRWHVRRTGMLAARGSRAFSIDILLKMELLRQWSQTLYKPGDTLTFWYNKYIWTHTHTLALAKRAYVSPATTVWWVSRAQCVNTTFIAHEQINVVFFARASFFAIDLTYTHNPRSYSSQVYCSLDYRSTYVYMYIRFI